MSGPKVDIARLREQEMKKLVQARQQRKTLADKIRAELKHMSISIPQGTETSLMDAYAKVQSIQAEYMARFNKLLQAVCMGNELMDCQRYQDELEELLKTYNAAASSYQLQIMAISKSSNELQQIENRAKKFSQFKRVEIKKTSTMGTTIEAPVKEVSLTDSAQELQQAICTFISKPGVTASKKNSVIALHREVMEISQSHMDNRKKLIRIQRLRDDFLKIQELAEVEIIEMKQLYEYYLSECFDATTAPKQLSEFSSKQELLDETKAVSNAVAGALSKEYICRQINEVMTKQGYDIVRSDFLTDAEESGQVLYGVDDKTAINVFMSNDSQVTMRVVGIGFDESISAEEDESLFQQQCAFCALHPKITKELEMRGVILETRKHLPPDKRFNKKIKTKTKTTSVTTSRAKKELKRSESKVMRKE